MFETIGAPELIIIGLVVVLLFGVGKIGNLGKELGTSVKEFRKAMAEDDQASGPPALPAAGGSSWPGPDAATAYGAQQPPAVAVPVPTAPPSQPPPSIF